MGAIYCNSLVCAMSLRPPRQLRKHSTRNANSMASQSDDGTTRDIEPEGVQLIELTGDTVKTGQMAGIESSTNRDVENQRKTFLEKFLHFTNLIVLVRSPLLALIILADILIKAVWIGWALFLVPHAQSLGISQSQAAYLAMLGGIGGIIGLVISSTTLAIRPDMAPNMAVVSSVSISFVFVLDLVSSSFVFQAVHAFLVGLLLFHQASFLILAVKFTVPDQDFEIGLGFVFVAIGVGGLIGGFGAGLIYDLTQDYKLVFVAFGVVEFLVFLSYSMYVFWRRRLKTISTGTRAAAEV